MEESHKFIGKQYLLDLHNCSKFPSTMDIQQTVYKMLRDIGATVLNVVTTPFGDLHSSTILFTLSESSAELHLYPEIKSCFVGIFTCGDTITPSTLKNHLLEYFSPESFQEWNILRGKPTNQL